MVWTVCAGAARHRKGSLPVGLFEVATPGQPMSTAGEELLRLAIRYVMEWIEANEAALLWLAGSSTFVFLATLIAVPWLVTRIPRDYFTHKRRRPAARGGQHPMLRALLTAGKNMLGVVFVAVGLAMLVLPGQGVMTILVGILLLDLPGKYRLECWVVRRKPILRSINWLRRRAGRPPLVVPARRCHRRR